MINNLAVNDLVNFLIEQHSFGSYGDRVDVNKAVNHSLLALELVDEFLSNINGTNEEKLSIIRLTMAELKKI